MRSEDLSPLEFALLGLFHRLYGARGFPPPEHIRVHRRENTGAGRYVDLLAASEAPLVEDGDLDLGGHFVQMEGVPYGLMAIVFMRNHRPELLEIAVYGNVSWDGTERTWSIV